MDITKLKMHFKWLAIVWLGLFSQTLFAFENLPASPGNPSFFLPSSTGGIAHFMGSSNCGSCHDSTAAQCRYVNSPANCTGNGSPLAYFDNDGKDVSIREAWGATMMANSSRDPLWRAEVKSELKKHPELSAEINDTCTKCHAPMANADAKAASQTFNIFNTVDANNTVLAGILNTGNARHDMAADGVSCSLCHQIKDDPTLGTLEGSTGGYKIDMTLAGVNRIMYGPYPDNTLFPGPMRNNQAFGGALRSNPKYSAHISSSKMCGTCHDLKTPSVDADGNILTPTLESQFPEQMPYSEWVHSAFNNDVQPAGPEAQSCQQCHMERTNGVYISTQPSGNMAALTKKDNFAIHQFVGGNKLMLDIFNNNKTQLGILSNNFGATMAATDTMLHNAGDIVSTETNGKAKLEFTLRANSDTGHKLPSAYPSRRVILHVQVKNALGQVVWESGKINANGSVEGVDADTTPGGFEPHYDLITDQGQVQVYESIMGNDEDQVTYTLLRGHHYKKDNRLLPRGFDKLTASDDIKVVGDAFIDKDFVGGSDDVTYRISNLPNGQYTVEAEMIYQTLSYGFAQNLFADNDISEVNDFKSMFDASSQKSQLIASNEFTVSVQKLGDIDGDNDVDLNDINQILAAKNKPATGSGDLRDLNNDMKIDLLDSRQATLLCTRPRCAVQ
jgi:hypothetical protein